MCRELKEMGFIGIYSIINAPVSLEQAMRQDWATVRIRCTVEQILTTMKHCAGTLLFQKGGD
jgi:glycerate kinase